MSSNAVKSSLSNRSNTVLTHGLALKSLLLLSLLSLSIGLAGCSTTRLFGPTSLTEASRIQCAPAKPITYSSSKDTAETIKQVRVHNQTYGNLKCAGF